MKSREPLRQCLAHSEARRCQLLLLLWAYCDLRAQKYFQLFGEGNFWSLRCFSGGWAVKFIHEEGSSDASECHNNTSFSCKRKGVVKWMSWLVPSDNLPLPVELWEAGHRDTQWITVDVCLKFWKGRIQLDFCLQTEDVTWDLVSEGGCWHYW